MTVHHQINQLKQEMHLKEIADDGYYISHQYQEDCKTLYALKQQLNIISSNQTVIKPDHSHLDQGKR